MLIDHNLSYMCRRLKPERIKQVLLNPLDYCSYDFIRFIYRKLSFLFSLQVFFADLEPLFLPIRSAICVGVSFGDGKFYFRIL